MRAFIICTFLFLGHLAFAQSSQAILLPPSINSSYTEAAPLISVDGQKLYFSRLGHPGNMGAASASDIWLSYKQPNNSWSKSINVGAPVNSFNADVVVGLSTAQQTISISRPDESGLYQSFRKGRVWHVPAIQQIDSTSAFDEDCQFHISHDGRVLFLSLPAPNGGPHHDLYVSTRQDENEWSAPLHCGSVLNSNQEEQSAFLAADGRSLYFSSDRPGGQGGFDLYMSRRIGDSWNNWPPPVNLGAGINSPNDEYSISLPAKGTTAYFVRAVNGDANIYMATVEENINPGQWSY
jgi:OOP family OmpA-OmpF porin